MKNRAGFTLIELLIVIVILGLLASLVAPKMFGKEESSKIKIAQTQMKMLETSLDTFRLDVGSYPDNLNELLKSDKKGWDGPYLPKDLPLDPWGNPYVYSATPAGEKPYNMLSYGADGKEGGEGKGADVLHQ
ncbi:type II secretion system major pseudopilin GspG [Rheinheimera texasensis]|uniref:type II secretion system major pseudopilin GspG n=1 Tax=Rheinheimera texasensis TaxID=306205 RepID=UPI0004E1006F|nr:type II secretion system major pseudopilin GspG [Rheinheimera texasensis]